MSAICAVLGIARRTAYYVVRRRPGGRYHCGDDDGWGSIRTAFPRACREAKVEDFRFHDLRHTFASWLVMRGRSLRAVQELLGHKTLTMTLRYAHLAPERLREDVSALDDFSTTSAHGTPKGAEPLVNSRQI
jgi:integrase